MKINEKNLTGFAVSNSPIDKDGWLLKRGEVNKSFQRRWFVLKGNLFFYFEKKTDKEPSGVIILEGCTIELAEYEEQYAFKIVFHGAGDRTYVMGADTQENMEGWMKALACASYDYMKLMVSELQRQLDEIVELEKAHVSIFDETTSIPGQPAQQQQARRAGAAPTTATATTNTALQKTGSAPNCSAGAEASFGSGFGVLANVAVGGVQCRRSPVLSSTSQQRINPFNRCQSDETFEKPMSGGVGGGATSSPGSAPGTPQHVHHHHHRQAAVSKSAIMTTSTSSGTGSVGTFKTYPESSRGRIEEVLVRSASTPVANASCRLFAVMHEKFGARIVADLDRWQAALKSRVPAINIPVGQLISLALD